MAFKPNYRHARSERSRAKQEKKAEKLRQQQERTAERKSQRDDSPEGDGDGPDGNVAD